ncbi:MAG TPA: hypothetical protein ACFYD3_06515 [Candidatus Hypogeohydataceae bacterium YC41]
MVIKGKSSICNKVVYEVRYKYGFTYLDRCGSTVNEIMKSASEWILSESSPNPQNAPLVSLRNGTRLNFSALKYDFSLEQPLGSDKDLEEEDTNEFTKQVDFVSSILNERLNLKDFTRVGFRIWYLFASPTKEDSERWISELLKEMPVDNSIATAFDGTIEAKNYIAIIAAKDRKFRISINGVERYAQVDLGENILGLRASQLSRDQNKFLLDQLKAKKRIAKNPAFAAMIDVDSFVEMPKDVEARDFITESLRQIEGRLPNAFT